MCAMVAEAPAPIPAEAPSALPPPSASRGWTIITARASRATRSSSTIGSKCQPGQLVVMTGPSGAGKTTLLTLIGALRSVQEGQIEGIGP